MQPIWKKFLRHAVLVGIALAVVGYLLGKAFLLTQQMYGGGAYIQENERVLWQTPLVMATLGIMMTGFIDLIGAMIRRPVKITVATPPPPNPRA